MAAERTEPKVVVYSHNGRWRWAYEEDSMRLASNDYFESPQAALDSAAVAYPDVTHVEVGAPEGADEPRRDDVPDLIRDLRKGVLVLVLFVLLYYLLRRRSHSVAGHG